MHVRRRRVALQLFGLRHLMSGCERAAPAVSFLSNFDGQAVACPGARMQIVRGCRVHDPPVSRSFGVDHALVDGQRSKGIPSGARIPLDWEHLPSCVLDLIGPRSASRGRGHGAIQGVDLLPNQLPSQSTMSPRSRGHLIARKRHCVGGIHITQSYLEPCVEEPYRPHLSQRLRIIVVRFAVELLYHRKATKLALFSVVDAMMVAVAHSEGDPRHAVRRLDLIYDPLRRGQMCSPRATLRSVLRPVRRRAPVGQGRRGAHPVVDLRQ